MCTSEKCHNFRDEISKFNAADDANAFCCKLFCVERKIKKFPHKAAILINYKTDLLALMKIATHIYSTLMSDLHWN